MEAKHVPDQEIRRLTRGGELGKSDEVCSLGEPIDHREDGGVATGRGQAGDEVQGDV